MSFDRPGQSQQSSATDSLLASSETAHRDAMTIERARVIAVDALETDGSVWVETLQSSTCSS